MKTLAKSVALAAVMMASAGLTPQFTQMQSKSQAADCTSQNSQNGVPLDCTPGGQSNFLSLPAGKVNPVWQSSTIHNSPLLSFVSSGQSQQPVQVGRISCAQGRSIVVASGYNSVNTISCGGGTYTYQARRAMHSYLYEVSVSAGKGTILGTTLE